MSTYNLGLNGCAFARAEMEPLAEKMLTPLGTTSEIRDASNKAPYLKQQILKALNPVEEIVCERFEQLSVKDVPFRTLESPSQSEWKELHALIDRISPGLSQLESWGEQNIKRDHPKVLELIQQYYPKTRRYFNAPVKCDPDNEKKCEFCPPPIAPKEILNIVRTMPLPDPVPDPANKGKYCSWEEQKMNGANTSEAHRTSLIAKGQTSPQGCS